MNSGNTSSLTEPATRADLNRVPGAVKGLSAVSLFNDLASEMVYPLLPAVITSLGGGAAVLGTLDGASDLTASVLRWFSGRLSDRAGWRNRLVVFGYLASSLVRPVITLAGSAWQVVGLRVVDRIGKGFRSPARDALIASLTPPLAIGRSFGIHRAADHAGAVLGSLVAWMLLTLGLSERSVIGFSIIPGVVTVIVLVFVLNRIGAHNLDRARRAESVHRHPEVVRHTTHHPSFWGAILALTFLTAARIPDALLLFFLSEVGVANTAIPLVWAVLHLLRSGAAYPGGVLADRLGVRSGLIIGTVLLTLSLILLANTTAPLAASLAFLSLGLATGVLEPAERATVAMLAPTHTGRAFGTAQALSGIAALPAGWGFGMLFQVAGGSTALMVSAGASLISAGLAYRFAPTRR